MSKVFRAKMVAALRQEDLLAKRQAQQLFEKNWVVYCKQPFHGPKQVIAYLGRYTHKIAISNHRIVDVSQGQVKFTAKDYRKGGRKHIINLKAIEFIRRFALHNLSRASGFYPKVTPESGTLAYWPVLRKKLVKRS